MSKLFARSNKQVEIVETVPDAEKTAEFRATVTRESFQRELLRSKTLEAFYELVRKLIDVLKTYKLEADSLMTTSSIVDLEELRLFILTSLTGHAKDKRLVQQTEPGFVARGALLLQDLIQKQRIAIDPAFYGSIFWPSAELRSANDAAWKTSGLVKLSHTKTDVPAVATLPGEALQALQAQADAFVARQMDIEARRGEVLAKRAELQGHCQRIAANLKRLQDAAKARAASKPNPEMPTTGAETVPGAAEGAAEGAEAVPGAEGAAEGTVEGTVPVAEAGAAPETKGESGAGDARLADLKTRLEAIQKDIEDDSIMFGPPENVQNLMTLLENCNQEILGLGAAEPAVVLDATPVTPPPSK